MQNSICSSGSKALVFYPQAQLSFARFLHVFGRFLLAPREFPKCIVTCEILLAYQRFLGLIRWHNQDLTISARCLQVLAFCRLFGAFWLVVQLSDYSWPRGIFVRFILPHYSVIKFCSAYSCTTSKVLRMLLSVGFFIVSLRKLRWLIVWFYLGKSKSKLEI